MKSELKAGKKAVKRVGSKAYASRSFVKASESSALSQLKSGTTRSGIADLDRLEALAERLLVVDSWVELLGNGAIRKPG